MSARFQADLVADPQGVGAVEQDGGAADRDSRSFAAILKRDDGPRVRALDLNPPLGGQGRGFDWLESGRERNPQKGPAASSHARKVALGAAEIDLLREACVDRDGEIKISAWGDFGASYDRAASAVHLTQLGYFEALPGEGWRLKPSLRAKMKATLKIE